MSSIKDAIEARKKALASKGATRDFSNQPKIFADFTGIEFASPEVGYPFVFRFMSGLLPTEPSEVDRKAIMVSLIASEDKKFYGKIIWDSHFDDRGVLVRNDSWILARFFADVMRCTWVDKTAEELVTEIASGKADPKKQKIKYNHAGDPVLEALSKDNNKTNWDKFGRSAFPQTFQLFQGIHRNDDWCEKQKHAKIFVSKLSYDTDDKGVTHTYVDMYGMDSFLFDRIFNHVDTYGQEYGYDMREIDFTLLKQPEGGNRKGFTYDINQDTNASRAMKKEESFAAMLPKYKYYDFAEIFPVSNYTTLKFFFGKKMKHWDDAHGSHYAEELAQLVKEEQAAYVVVNCGTTTVTEATTAATVVKTTQTAPIQTTQTTPEPVTQRTRRAVPDATAKVSDFDKMFPKFNELSDVDKKILKDNFLGWDDMAKKAKYTPSMGDSASCLDNTCKFPNGFQTMLPLVLTKCPVCGIDFTDDAQEEDDYPF